MGVNADSSVMYFAAVAARYEDNLPDSDKNICIGALNNLGYVYYFDFNNPLKSYEYLLKALKLSEENGIDNSLPHIYLNIANVYSSMGENLEAVKYLKKSIRSSAALHNEDILVISVIGLINEIFVTEAATFKSITPEIELFRNYVFSHSTELYDYTRLYINGIETVEKGDYATAIKSFEKARKSINSTFTPERYDYSLLSAIAKIQLLQDDYPKAIENLHCILSKISAPDIKVAVYNQLAEAFGKWGRVDSCNYYNRLYLELSDSIFRSGQLQTLHGLDNQYMTDKLNSHIEKAAHDRRNLIIVSCMLVIFLALALWAWVSRRRLLSANKLLYEKSCRELLCNENTATPSEKTRVCTDTNDLEDTSPAGHAPKEEGDEAAETKEAEEVDAELIKKITDVFASSKDVYSQEFSIERLSCLVGASERRVSKCLNNAMGTNFINEVQKSRIREACRLFEDKKTSSTLTIMAISDMVGFKSRTNFAQVFKNITGLTPSQYHKMSRGK